MTAIEPCGNCDAPIEIPLDQATGVPPCCQTCAEWTAPDDDA